jgi:hypothetical protein
MDSANLFFGFGILIRSSGYSGLWYWQEWRSVPVFDASHGHFRPDFLKNERESSAAAILDTRMQTTLGTGYPQPAEAHGTQSLISTLPTMRK